MQISIALYIYCLRCVVLSQTQPVLQTEQSQKSFWSKKKKVALVLAIILILAVILLLLLSFRPNNQVLPSPLNCSNGANFYPRCDSCPSGETLASNSCMNNCANGGTNHPSCNVFNPCSNGATNPPTCSVFPTCSNGAANSPTCTVFSTATNLACYPTSIVAQQLTSTVCTVTVSSLLAAAPTGRVSFTGSSAWYNSGSTCVLSPHSSGFSSTCTIRGVSVKDNFGNLVLTGTYLGDVSHLTSSGQTTVTVTSPHDTHCNGHDDHEWAGQESHEDRDCQCHFRSDLHRNCDGRDREDRSNESEKD